MDGLTEVFETYDFSHLGAQPGCDVSSCQLGQFGRSGLDKLEVSVRCFD